MQKKYEKTPAIHPIPGERMIEKQGILRPISDQRLMLVGAVLAQGSLFVSIPFILRWFSSSQVADWSILLSWVNLLWAFCQLKTDQALVQTTAPAYRMQLFYLGLCSNIILGGTILILAFQLGWILRFSAVIWMFFALILHGWHQMNLSWLLSSHQFRALTALRLLQALLAYPAALLLQPLLGPDTLLICFCGSNFCCGLWARVWGWSPGYTHFNWIVRAGELYRQHRNTFTYLALGNMVISVTDQALVIMVGQFFSPIVAAAYFMAARICSLPISMVNTALSQYNLRWFQDLKEQGQFKPIIPFRFWLKWLPISALYYVPILLFGKDLFGWLLGPDWMYAGSLASIVAVAAWFRFLSNPTSMGYFVMGRTEVFFCFSLLMSAPMWLCLLLGQQHWPLDAILQITAAVQIIILILYNILMLKMMQRT